MNIGNDPTGTSKIDSAPVDGLMGVPHSLAYMVDKTINFYLGIHEYMA